MFAIFQVEQISKFFLYIGTNLTFDLHNYWYQIAGALYILYSIREMAIFSQRCGLLHRFSNANRGFGAAPHTWDKGNLLSGQNA